jgi:hypothetical protein
MPLLRLKSFGPQMRGPQDDNKKSTRHTVEEFAGAAGG